MLNVENDNIKPENGNITPSEVDLKRANIIADTFVEKVETAAPVRIATAAVSSAAAIHALLRSERRLHRASAHSKKAFSLCVIGILSHFCPA